MKWGFVLFSQVALASLPASGQILNVYSEFAKIDTQGNVTAPETPREILSPALVRNGFTTFQVVVQVPSNTPYVLHIGQNPENAAKVTMYRSTAGRLQRVDEPINGNSTETFWMDVWIDKNDPVRRIKVEPELGVSNDWVLYPMEMRVRETMVSDVAPGAALSTTVPFEIFRTYVCDAKYLLDSKHPDAERPSNPKGAFATASELQTQEVPTIDALHVRNVRQDMAMASQLSTPARDDLRKWMGGCNPGPSDNPEAYLHVRDYFFTPLWMKIAHEK